MLKIFNDINNFNNALEEVLSFGVFILNKNMKNKYEKNTLLRSI